MRIGYLNLGSPKHGVCRYGRMIAGEASRQGGVEVLEVSHVLSGRVGKDRQQLRNICRKLFGADIIHIQYDMQPIGSIWGSLIGQVLNLRAFTAGCSALLVMTIHNIKTRSSPGSDMKQLIRHQVDSWKIPSRPYWVALFSTLVSCGRYVFNRPCIERVLLRAASRHAAKVLVCSNAEAKALSIHCPDLRPRVSIVPHFIEKRKLPADRERVRGELGLNDAEVVSLAGFLHERKGHRLLIEALAMLSHRVVAIFVGAPASGWSWYKDELCALARALGVAEQIRITGYLEEADFNRYLTATDLAVCPFEKMAASGSLATWIAAGRPILASDLPQVREYNRIAPGAISVFSPYTAAALASAIRRELNRVIEESTAAGMSLLRDQLSLHRMYEAHLEEYCKLL